jgi:hypothetical protein
LVLPIFKSWRDAVPKKQFLREKQKRVDKSAYIFNLSVIQPQKRLFSGDVWARLIFTGFRVLRALKAIFSGWFVVSE